MYLPIACLAMLSLVGSSWSEAAVAAPGLISSINPYYAGRNPLAPGYSPYYNTASATAPILTYSNNHGLDGSYSYSFTTGDGKQAQESGFLKDAYVDYTGAPQGTQVKEGSYGYISPEGIPIQVNYVADENGFRHGGVQIPANGNGVLPASSFNNLGGVPGYNALYNQYNPYNYRNRFGQFGQYNPAASFDGRYPYDPRYSLYNQYRSAPAVVGKAKEEIKKV